MDCRLPAGKGAAVYRWMDGLWLTPAGGRACGLSAGGRACGLPVDRWAIKSLYSLHMRIVREKGMRGLPAGRWAMVCTLGREGMRVDVRLYTHRREGMQSARGSMHGYSI